MNYKLTLNLNKTLQQSCLCLGTSSRPLATQPQSPGVRTSVKRDLLAVQKRPITKAYLVEGFNGACHAHFERNIPFPFEVVCGASPVAAYARLVPRDLAYRLHLS
jgi:hypothetical protein